ncbi:MFS general substrate transporter [Mycena kentingensis (nom. inval.)]|nr:MFS general substrate transporter [Mycena kentingensis (nom. inval.)]
MTLDGGGGGGGTETSTLVDPQPTTPTPSLPPSPTRIANPDPRTAKQRRAGRVQLAAFCGLTFIHGWTDGNLGPLIPNIQRFYALDYTTVSLVFVFQCVGYICGALGNGLMTNRYRFGSVLIAGSIFPLLGNALQAATPVVPFAVFVVGNALSGFGLGILNTQATGYIAVLRFRQKIKMGMFQASYGLGAFVGPLVSTAFAELRHWSFFYLIHVGIALLVCATVCTVFGRRTQEECLARIGQFVLEPGAEEKPLADPAPVPDPVPASAVPVPVPVPVPVVTPGPSLFKAAHAVMRLPAVHLLASFTFICVGIEVMVAGWIVTFLIEVRGGGAASRYAAAGFWGGFMIGRFGMLPVTRWLGERRAMYIYSIISIGLELIIWFIPNLVVSGTAAALIGLFFGPMYPIMINHTARILPPVLLTASIAWLAAVGAAGAAVLPVIAGALAGKVGFKSMQPLTIGILVLLMGMWAIVPTKQVARRKEETQA